MITIAETLQYQRKAKRLLSSVEQSELITYLSINPKAGVLIEDTGESESCVGGKLVEGKALVSESSTTITVK